MDEDWRPGPNSTLYFGRLGEVAATIVAEKPGRVMLHVYASDCRLVASERFQSVNAAKHAADELVPRVGVCPTCRARGFVVRVHEWKLGQRGWRAIGCGYANRRRRKGFG